MIVTCEKCRRRYNLQEDKLHSDARKVRCRNCNSLITLPRHKLKEGHAPQTPKADAAREPKADAAPAPKAHATPAPKVHATPASKAHVTSALKSSAAPLPGSHTASASKGHAAPTPRRRHWYAMVQGGRVGPLSDDALAIKAREGEINSETFVWRSGMPDWKRAGDVAHASSLLSIGGPKPSEPMAPTAQAGTPLHGMGAPDPIAAFGAADVPTPLGEEQAAPFEGDVVLAELVAAESTHSPSTGAETHVLFEQFAVGRRHPHWKFAPVLVALVALPLILVFMFSGPPLPRAQGTRADESGRDAKGPASSSAGSRLGDVLLGRRNAHHASSAGSRRATAEPPLLQRAGPAGSGAPSSKSPELDPTAKPGEGSEPVPPGTATLPELNALYGDGTHTDVGPRVRKGEDEKGKDTTVGGLGQKEVAKVVSHAQPAFQFCIEQELKKNPKFHGGKIFITATIGGSGIVKKAAVDRPEIDSSPLGECLKGKARRMVFPAFSGDETEIQIPLILGATM